MTNAVTSGGTSTTDAVSGGTSMAASTDAGNTAATTGGGTVTGATTGGGTTSGLGGSTAVGNVTGDGSTAAGGSTSGGTTGGLDGTTGGTMGGATGNTSAGGANGAGGSMGGTTGGDVPVAVATIAPTTAAPAGWEGFSATATFTQEGNMVTLVIEATGCPDGLHIAHLHANLECGPDGETAGAHWIPNGEVLEDMLCESETGSYTHSESTDVWSIGGDAETDITQHAYMVHALSDAEGAGAKAACGSINAQ
jgi:hypothetical protein